MVRVYQELEIDLEEFETEELVQELKDRGEYDNANHEEKIKDLREDFVTWYGGGMKNERFEDVLKQFFRDTIGEHVI